MLVLLFLHRDLISPLTLFKKGFINYLYWLCWVTVAGQVFSQCDQGLLCRHSTQASVCAERGFRVCGLSSCP